MRQIQSSSDSHIAKLIDILQRISATASTLEFLAQTQLRVATTLSCLGVAEGVGLALRRSEVKVLDSLDARVVHSIV
jgi:hypothetical protein